MQLCIFEDSKTTNFYPLTYSRPVYDLLCGCTTLKEKIFRAFPSLKHSVHCRKYLQNVYEESNSGLLVNSFEDNECLFINGRIIADVKLLKIFSRKKKENIVYVTNDTVVAAYLSGTKLQSFKQNLNDSVDISLFNDIPVEEIDIPLLNYTWDLINLNGQELLNDYKFFSEKRKKKNQKRISGKVYDGVHLINKKEIIIEKGAVVKPGVVVDASNGPVYIDKNVEVFPNAVIEGPVYIGENSKIKSGAVVYDNTTIGKVCKIGGEVEASVIMPFTNKQHAGFLGHSYLGSWVNLGADTNNSDLKNNYSSVKVSLNGKTIDTGLQFLGLIMGDHSKSAINTMFNTGTIAGFSCNIFGAGFPKKNIPSFSWGGNENPKVYDVEKAMDTAKIVMARRGLEFNDEMKKLFKYIFELTDKERRGQNI